jgi:hypothetical protein
LERGWGSTSGETRGGGRSWVGRQATKPCAFKNRAEATIYPTPSDTKLTKPRTRSSTAGSFGTEGKVKTTQSTQDSHSGWYESRGKVNGMRSRNDNRRSHCSGPPTRRLLTRIATTACTLLSTTLALTTAIAGPSDSEPAHDHEPDRGSSFIAPRSSQLLGDFGGARGRLEDAGVLIQLFYHQTLAWKAPGA